MPLPKKTSPVWTFFTMVDREEVEVDNEKWETHDAYKCNECGKLMWYQRKRGTSSHMRGHIMTKNREAYRELREQEEAIENKKKEDATVVQTQSTLHGFARTFTSPSVGKGKGKSPIAHTTQAVVKKRKGGRNLDYDQDVSNRKLAKIIINDGLPLSIVESKTFKLFIKYNNPLHIMPS